MKKIDATKCYFKSWKAPTDVFSFLIREDRPSAVEDVEFVNLEYTHYDENGVHFHIYGDGTVYESAGVLLDDGTYLFCVINGTRFIDTFSSNDDIRMQYYSVRER